MRMELQWNGTERELIEFSNRCSIAESGDELDSMDKNSAIDFWISQAMMDLEFSETDEISGCILKCNIDFGDTKWRVYP